MSVSFQETELFRVLTGRLSRDILEKVQELAKDRNIRERGAYRETYLHCLMAPRPPPRSHDTHAPAVKKRKKKQKKKDETTPSPVVNGNQHLETPQDPVSVKLINALIYQLVALGIDVNSRDVEKNTPLHIACVNDVHPEVVATFIRVGADPTLVNEDGCTALDIAEVEAVKRVLEASGRGLYREMVAGNLEQLALLLNWNCRVQHQHKGQPLLNKAKQAGNEELTSLLLEHEATSGVVFATLAGDEELTKYFAKDRNVDLNTVVTENLHEDQPTETCLLLAAIRHFRFNTASVLVDNGADVNLLIRNSEQDDEVPLFVYLLNTEEAMDQNLLYAILEKSDLALLNWDPFELFLTTWRRGYSLDIVNIFLERGYFAIETRNLQCLTVRDRILQESYHVPHDELRLNLWHVDRHIVELAQEGQTDQLITLAQSGYDYLRVFNPKGRSIVDLAMDKKKRETAGFLEMYPEYQRKGYKNLQASIKGNLSELKDGMEDTLIAFRDRAGRTALHLAVLYERPFIVKWLANTHPEIMNMIDICGRTPYHYACALEDGQDLRTLLLNAGAMDSMMDNDERTPDDFIGDTELINSERSRATPETYLLDRYLHLSHAIEFNDLENFTACREALVGATVAEMDLALPEKFPRLHFRPLTFQCLPRGQEEMAILLLESGANRDAVHEMETPSGARQALSLQEAAETWNCRKVLDYLRGDNEAAERQMAQQALSAVVDGDWSPTGRGDTPDSLRTDCTLPDFGGESDSSGHGTAVPPDGTAQSSTCVIL